MPIIETYLLKHGENLQQALWSSGVYQKKDTRTLEEVAEGKPMKEIFCEIPYLINGECSNCLSKGGKPHSSLCPVSTMQSIKNLVIPICVICKKQTVDDGEPFCGYCEEEAEQCSCMSGPDWCEMPDEHDDAYYAKKRAEWKANLAELASQKEGAC